MTSVTTDGKNLSAAKVRELFDYNPKTGDLIWKARKGMAKAGDIAGTVTSRGYRVASVDKKRYRIHRLVWAWHHGKWPEFEIDHVDRDKLNNRIQNLRDVTHRVNRLNAPPCGQAGLSGVQRHFNKFRARIFDPTLQKTLHIGSYETAEEAEEAFKRKSVEIHGIDSIHFDTHHTPNPRLIAACAKFRA